MLVRIAFLLNKGEFKYEESVQTTPNTSSNNTQKFRLLNKMLTSDQQFFKSFKIVKNEFDDGYKEIINQSQSYNKPE
jgi:hypothetical protein